MRLLVVAPSLVDAAVVLLSGNQSAAACHRGLVDRLEQGRGMAGDASIAGDFAATYDDAADACVDAVAALVDAFAAFGRLTDATRANHARAEARSTLTRPHSSSGPASLPDPGYMSVAPVVLPSSLGGDSSSVPDWAAWILDRIEGFVWPDADVDRLRAVASAWRAAADQVARLADCCESAVESLVVTRSPEVPVAVEVVERLARQCLRIADQAMLLATACDEYADRVEEQRAAILDLVHDLLRDAMVIQGVGVVLGVITGGATAAGAAALNTAKIAAAAPRLLHVLATLRSPAATCAVPARFASGVLRDVRAELAVFQRVRTTAVVTREADHTARMGRLRSVIDDPRRFDPQELRGLSKSDVRDLCEGWPSRPSRSGPGTVFDDPTRQGRQIRIMDGYGATRPEPVTHGPYVVVSQNGAKPIKMALWGNPIL